MIEADKEVDARYEFLRSKHGAANPQANGYRVSSFFEREQRVLLAAVDHQNGPFLDIACGSGLMLAPLLKEGHEVFGLDFNAQACRASYQNGITMMRGDAFNLPLANETIGQIVNCQFLNQQPPSETQKFIEECARILKPGGQLIILWRHAKSLAHRSAHAVFTLKDRFTGQPSFPQYEHPIAEIESYARGVNLITQRTGTTLPFMRADMIKANGIMANIIGASLFIVLRKP